MLISSFLLNHFGKSFYHCTARDVLHACSMSVPGQSVVGISLQKQDERNTRAFIASTKDTHVATFLVSCFEWLVLFSFALSSERRFARKAQYCWKRCAPDKFFAPFFGTIVAKFGPQILVWWGILQLFLASMILGKPKCFGQIWKPSQFPVGHHTLREFSFLFVHWTQSWNMWDLPMSPRWTRQCWQMYMHELFLGVLILGATGPYSANKISPNEVMFVLADELIVTRTRNVPCWCQMISTCMSWGGAVGGMGECLLAGSALREGVWWQCNGQSGGGGFLYKGHDT